MEEGLPRAQIAWIYVGCKVVLIDPCDLVSEEGVMAEIVVDPGRSQMKRLELDHAARG